MLERPDISVLIPTLDEQRWLPHCLASVRASLDHADVDGEIVVCDGGSTDATPEIARRAADRFVETARAGRARQLETGARRARGRIYATLHADSIVAPRWARWIATSVADGAVGGWFQVQLLPEESRDPILRGLDAVETGINWRTRAFCTATGDQGVFAHRDAWDRVGGVPNWNLLEGWGLARRLADAGDVAVGGPWIRISARRWERGGLIRTSLLMYLVRLGFACGVSPERLERFWDQRTPEG